jgi:SAM-dependent methyltransferase
MGLTSAERARLIVLRRCRRRNDVPEIFAQLGVSEVMEVGVRFGRHLRKLLAPGCVQRAVAIDAWSASGTLAENDSLNTQAELDAQYAGICRLAEHDARLTVVRAHSAVAAHQFPAGSFDFVYLDADHTYEAVARDLRLYAPLVRPGGILGGHDYHDLPNWTVPFEVKRAVQAFLFRHNLRERLHVTADYPPSWYVVMGEA